MFDLYSRTHGKILKVVIANETIPEMLPPVCYVYLTCAVLKEAFTLKKVECMYVVFVFKLAVFCLFFICLLRPIEYSCRQKCTYPHGNLFV